MLNLIQAMSIDIAEKRLTKSERYIALELLSIIYDKYLG
jgi:hypothetical protein